MSLALLSMEDLVGGKERNRQKARQTNSVLKRKKNQFSLREGKRQKAIFETLSVSRGRFSLIAKRWTDVPTLGISTQALLWG